MRSKLIIHNAGPEAQGEYLCKPDNKWVTWVAVKVIKPGQLRSNRHLIINNL